MEGAEIDFEVMAADVDETPPAGLASEKVPGFLAEKKAIAIAQKHPDRIIVAADTIVILEGEILGKPKDSADAIETLQKLSGKKHLVITGVCIKYAGRQILFSAVTEVFFRELNRQQIEHYVNCYQPFDKAGAYAIQEWIGMVGIEKISGDYYNVMGLPVGEVVKRINLLKTGF